MKTQNKWQRIGIIFIAIMIGVGVPEYLNSQNVTDIDISNEPNGQESNIDALKFVRTVDGNTIIVEDAAGEHRRVRMIGIDTTEYLFMARKCPEQL